MLALGAAVVAAGCTFFVTSAVLTPPEKDDSVRMDQAMAKERGSQFQAAILLYEEILKENPAHATAHFHLALLLHNHQKAYLEAIHHYMAYLDLAPEGSLKSTVEAQLASAIADLRAQWNAIDIARAQATLIAERDGLRSEVASLKDRIAGLQDERHDLQQEIVALQRRIENLTKMVDEMRTVDVKTPVAPPVSAEALKEEVLKIEETPEAEPVEDIAAIRDLAKIMIEAEDGGQKEINEATRQAVEGKTDTPTILATPTPGKRYVVRPGDTFYSVSRDAYGSSAHWTKVRDANRGATNPNHRLRAGETILIPQL